MFPRVGRVTATMIAGTTVTNSTVQVGQQIGSPISVSDKFNLFHDQRASNMSKNQLPPDLPLLGVTETVDRHSFLSKSSGS